MIIQIPQQSLLEKFKVPKYKHDILLEFGEVLCDTTFARLVQFNEFLLNYGQELLFKGGIYVVWLTDTEYKPLTGGTVG